MSKRKPIVVSCIFKPEQALLGYCFNLPMNLLSVVHLLQKFKLLLFNHLKSCTLMMYSVFGQDLNIRGQDIFHFVFFSCLLTSVPVWKVDLYASLQRSFFPFCFPFNGVNYTFCPHPNLSNPSFP